MVDTTGEAEKSFSVLKKHGKCCSISTIPNGQVARENVMNSQQFFLIPTLLDVFVFQNKIPRLHEIY
jgi:hypothetical protein